MSRNRERRCLPCIERGDRGDRGLLVEDHVRTELLLVSGHERASTIGVPLGPSNTPRRSARMPLTSAGGPFHGCSGSQLGRGCRCTGLSDARVYSLAAKITASTRLRTFHSATCSLVTL